MRRIVALLFMATVLSTGILISTLAKYTNAYSGGDMALVSKWAFGVTVDSSSFSEFNIFDNITITPMIESGEYAFNITGNRSDTAIDFDVKINMDDLSKSIGTNDERLPIMIFISVASPYDNSITYTAQSAYSGVSFIDNWFYIGDCKKSDGSFELNPAILTGQIPANNAESLAVSIKWQWNTSYFIPNAIIGSCSSDSAGDNGFNNTSLYVNGTPAYYASATQVYNNLISAKNDSQDNFDTWKETHAQWFLGGTDTQSTDAEGNPVTTHYPCSTSCELSASAHSSAYSSLKSSLSLAKQAVADSLKLAYDKYDTNVITGLGETPINVLFTVSGVQKEPE